MKSLPSLALLCSLGMLHAADLPHFRAENGVVQLLVSGRPYLIRGGELGNSSSAAAEQADAILPAMARLHLNTVLMPVAWEQLEPREGVFDFTILDHWIDVARRQQLHLVLLWFGSWKNAFSEYAPAWVKSDPRRFPRAQSAHGVPLEILSTFGAETLRADARAFRTLMAHLRDSDRDQQTVLMIQVENEMGYLGPARDRSPEAGRQFAAPVPPDLIPALTAHHAELSPKLAAHFNSQGHTWREVFGDAANEVFMAWRYAVYRATAPAIDFYAPDIYWPEFEYWVQRYKLPANPVFIPEARLDPAPWNVLYAYGAAHAIGFCPFAIDSVPADPEPPIAQLYSAIAGLEDLLLTAQREGRTRGLVLHANSPRATQSVALGGYVFEASLSRAWGTNVLQANDGGMLLLESQPGEFLVLGSGLTVKITRDPDTDANIAGIASVEEVFRSGANWTVKARLNGDQTNQGRQLTMDPRQFRTYRLRLYSTQP